MASAPQNGSERLDSWKAIAAYLNRDERTVRRWGRDLGLPVRRVPGGRGTSVFAYAAEIDAWLNAARPSEPPATGAVADTDRGAPAPPRSRRLWLPLAAAVSLLIAMAVVWRVVDSSATERVLHVELTPSALVAFDAANVELWRHAFPADERAVLFGDRAGSFDMLGGSDPAVFAAVPNRFRRSDDGILDGQLLWLTPRGVLQRVFSFDDRLTFGAGQYGAPWAITGFVVEQRANARRVAVAAHHYTWWPSMVTVLDQEWRRQGTFVNPGWIEWVQWVSADRLVIAGFSEAYDGGMLALLNADAVDGQAPADAESAFHCAACGPGRPLRYIVMPRSEVNRASASRFNRARLQREGDRLVARTIEVPQDEGDAADALYEFTPSLELIRASFSTRYWDVHRELEQQGKLDHTREQCADRAGPRDIRVWEPATGWRTAKRGT